MTLVVERAPEGRSRFNLIYDAELLRHERAEAILHSFTQALADLLGRPDDRVGALVRAPGRAPAADRPTTLGKLFDAAARRDPAATAVTQCGPDGAARSLTYGELAAAKTTLATALRAAGVRPGRRVAVAVPRSVEQVVALVAAVTAGGAYVPWTSPIRTNGWSTSSPTPPRRSSSWTGSTGTASPGSWTAPA